jgi:hypothetical protein
LAWLGMEISIAVMPRTRYGAASLVANFEVEGDGARKLWKIAGRAEHQHEAKLVQQHAIDEARHARLYIHMLETVFPGAIDPERAFGSCGLT